MLRQLSRVSPTTGLVVGVSMGAAFLVLSSIVGNLAFKVCWSSSHFLAGPMSCPTGEAGAFLKDVGFATSLNWSLNLIIIFPLFLFFALKTAESARQALDRLRRSEMLVNDRFEIARMQELQKIIEGRLVLGGRVLVFLTVLITAFLWQDFSEVVLHYYWAPEDVKTIPLEHSSAEVDWSIAAPVCEAFSNTSAECRKLTTPWVWTANAVFAGLAYVALPWFGAVATCAFLIYFFLFAVMFTSGDFAKRKFFIIPDLDSKEPRRGFEILEPLFASATTAAFLAFAFGLLVVLQNVYLRSSAPNIVAAVTDPSRLFDNVLNGNTVGVMAVGGLIALAMVVASSQVLKRAAENGKHLVIAAIDAGDKNVQNVMQSGAGHLTTQYVRTMLTTNFEYWPFSWFRLNTLLIALGAAVFSLFFVNLGVYVVLAGMFMVWFQQWLSRNPGQPLRVLMGISNPMGSAQLHNLLEETRRISNAMDEGQRLPRRSAFKSLLGVQLDDLKLQLGQFRPTVLHLSGHGSPNGILLHHQNTFMHLAPNDLQALLLRTKVRLVILNCCYSGAYGAQLLGTVDAVVGGRRQIFDDAARDFGIEFHCALVEGASVSTAMSRAQAKAEESGAAPGDFVFEGAGDLVLVPR